jgi:hypothetical protein
MAQAKEKAEEVSLEGVFAEYLKVNKDLASRIFFDLRRDIQKFANSSDYDIDEKSRTSYVLGRICGAFDLLSASLQVAEEFTDYHNEDISNAIVASIEVLLKAYADLKAGKRRLPEVNDRLEDYIRTLNDTFMHLISDLIKRAKDG